MVYFKGAFKTSYIAIAVIIIMVVAAIAIYFTTTPKPTPTPTPTSPTPTTPTIPLQTSPSPTPTIPIPKTIKVGAVVCLTGTNARYGQYYATAYKLAADEINKEGGIYIKEYGRKIPIELIILDDESDREKTVKLVDYLCTEVKVVALLSGCGTPFIYPQSSVAIREKVPYLTAVISTETLLEGGKRKSPYLFSMLVMIDVLARNMMDLLKENIDKGVLPKPLKIANIWENTPHGLDWRRGIYEKVLEYPGYFEVVVDESVEVGATEFRPLLLKIEAAGANALMVDIRLTEMMSMHRQLVEMGIYGKYPVITYGARGGEKTFRDEFKDKSDYVIWGTFFSDRLPYPQIKSFIEKWKKVSDLPVEWYAAVGYENARIMFKAIEAAGSLDRDKIRDALQNIVVEDVMFPGQKISFDEFGMVHYPYLIVQNVPEGQTRIIYPPELAEATFIPIGK
jgi:branched-chain amino acid transport system substrate-binding protein